MRKKVVRTFVFKVQNEGFPQIYQMREQVLPKEELCVQVGVKAVTKIITIYYLKTSVVL